MVEQVAEWRLFRPIPDPVTVIYEGLYWELSSAAHLIPDTTLVGRRFVTNKPMVPMIEFSANDLARFARLLVILVDIGIVLTVNLVKALRADDDPIEERLLSIVAKAREVLPNGLSAS